MVSQTVLETQEISLDDLVDVVETMGIGDTKQVRLLGTPKGMVPNAEMLTFYLSQGGYRVSIVQDIAMTPDCIEIRKSVY